MKKYTLVVLTNPVDGHEEEYNRWYDTQHLRDVLQVPGFVAARRLRLAAEQPTDAKSPWRYLALYDIETSDLEAALAELNKRGGGPAMPLSTALDVPGVSATVFEAL